VTRLPLRLLRSVPVWLAAAWAMSLTTLGFFVVPMLFAHLPSPALAGAMAARLFSVQSAVSVACALALLLTLRADRFGVDAELAQGLALWLLAGALLALLVEFGVSPRIVSRENPALWHGLGSLMYFAQWVCALQVFGRLALPRDQV